MASNAQPNGGGAGQPKQVTRKTVTFSKSLWTKQFSEDQDDAFGFYMKSITLTKAGTDGKPVTHWLQKDGKPVDGVLSTYDRQLVKLAGLPYFVGPSTQKGGGYIATVASHLVDVVALMDKLTAAGYTIEYLYGTRGEWLTADPKLVKLYLNGLVAMHAQTTKAHPDAEGPAKTKADAAPVMETVSLEL